MRGGGKSASLADMATGDEGAPAPLPSARSDDGGRRFKSLSWQIFNFLVILLPICIE